MLSELHIKNFAIINEANIKFTEGLNIFTGETGTGKSVIIKALIAVLGGPFRKDMIKMGQDSALVVAVFEKLSNRHIAALKDLGCFLDEERKLVITRRINLLGRSSCDINGVPVSVAVLKAIALHIVDIHGQFDSIKISKHAEQLLIIDKFGNLQEQTLKYSKVFQRWQKRKEYLDSLLLQNENKTQRIEFLKFQIDDIESAKLYPHEDEELAKKRELINKSEKLKKNLTQIISEINNDNSNNVLDGLKVILQNLEEYSEQDAELKTKAEQVQEMIYSIEDLLEVTCNKLRNFEEQQLDINSIEARLDVIYKLKLKYGSSAEDIIKTCEVFKEELSTLTFSEENIKKLKEEIDVIFADLKVKAEKLTGLRLKAAKQFASVVEIELRSLNMPYVRFLCNYSAAELGICGADNFEFAISTNKGNVPMPISKIASGGEISRIMLAIKTVMHDEDDANTMIFDEIDTGISGLTSRLVGERLKALSCGLQVICITHSAAIAAFADTHFLIEKVFDAKNTFTQIKKLDDLGRELEIARIMSGDLENPQVIESAKELIKAAKFKKERNKVG